VTKPVRCRGTEGGSVRDRVLYVREVQSLDRNPLIPATRTRGLRLPPQILTPPITLVNADQVHRRTLGLYREIALNGELEALESLPLLQDARGRPVHRPTISDVETRA
jgi:hypothetical protein